MNKSELIESIATKTGSTRVDAAAMLDAALGAITEALTAGDSVAILGFGNFKVSERAARTGKNPATGEALEIAAATVAKFTPGKALKDAVNSKK
jgi:nucleoid DNA-binding protein